MELKIDISGSDKIINNLKKFGEEGLIITEKLLKIKSQEIANKAKELAPVDIGNLRENIVNEEIAPLQYQVSAKAFYSAYMEFGTGKRVKVPQEFNSMALEFKNRSTGSYEDGLKRIKAWLKKQGGNTDDAEFVFMLILINGLKPRPFMYPAFLYGRKIYKKDMDFEFKRLIKKFNND